LLRKPEPELKSADTNCVEFLDEKNAESVGTHKPDDEAQTDEPQVGAPVSQAIILVHECSAYCQGGSMYQGFRSEDGAILTGASSHFMQDDSPYEIGTAINAWLPAAASESRAKKSGSDKETAFSKPT